jgi:hypothetical protein
MTDTQDILYVAHIKLLIHTPGQTPSALRVKPGDIFSLDGNEGIKIERLLASGAASVYVPPPAKKRKRGNA